MCLTVFKYFIGPICLFQTKFVKLLNLVEFVLDNCWIPGGLSWFRILFELSMQVFGLVSLVA